METTYFISTTVKTALSYCDDVITAMESHDISLVRISKEAVYQKVFYSF
jgi:hypothetical protein